MGKKIYVFIVLLHCLMWGNAQDFFISGGNIMSGTSCVVRWETESETDNDFFTVQVSTDGITFFDVSQIVGAGTSNTTMQYSIEFDVPEYGVFYVRLQQTDFDGESTFSQVLPIKGNIAYFVVQSNHELRINLSQFDENASLHVQLLDAKGSLVYANYFADTDSDFVTIPLSSSISKGVYVLKIKENNIVFSTKIYVK